MQSSKEKIGNSTSLRTAVLLLLTSAQSCLTLCDPTDCSQPGSSVHGIFPGKNTAVGCRALLQEIFPTPRQNPGLLCLLHWQAGSLPLVPPRSPKICKCFKIVTRFWIEKSKYRLNEWQISRLQEYFLGYTKLYLKEDDKIILLNQCISTLASQLNSTKNLEKS